MAADQDEVRRRESDWERSERISYRVAMAIALMPIPIALLISWALGSPPWRSKPAHNPDHAETRQAPAEPGSAIPGTTTRHDRGDGPPER